MVNVILGKVLEKACCAKEWIKTNTTSIAAEPQPKGVILKPKWLAKYLQRANPWFIGKADDFQGKSGLNCILPDLILVHYRYGT